MLILISTRNASIILAESFVSESAYGVFLSKRMPFENGSKFLGVEVGLTSS